MYVCIMIAFLPRVLTSVLSVTNEERISPKMVLTPKRVEF